MATGEVCTCKPHSIGAHIWRIRINHYGSTQISTTQVGSGEISITELRALQVSAIETGTTQVCPFKVGFPQIGISEISITKVSADQVSTLQTSGSQITAGTGTADQQSLLSRSMRLHEQGLNRFSLRRSDRNQCADQKGSGELNRSELIHGSSASVSVLDNLVSFCRGPWITRSQRAQKPFR